MDLAPAKKEEPIGADIVDQTGPKVMEPPGRIYALVAIKRQFRLRREK